MPRYCFSIFSSLKKGKRSFRYRTTCRHTRKCPHCRQTSSPAAVGSKKLTTSTRTFSTIRAITGLIIFKTNFSNSESPVAKQQSSETLKLPLEPGKARQARGLFRLEVLSAIEAENR